MLFACNCDLQLCQIYASTSVPTIAVEARFPGQSRDSTLNRLNCLTVLPESAYGGKIIMRALAHLSVVFTLVIRGQCRVLPGGAPAPAANKFALETRVRNWHWNQYSKHIGTVDVSRPLLNPCKGEMPDRASIASYHKAGTKASAQLTEILNTSHDYYYHGYAKPYTSPVVVVTRNPFDLVLSG